MASSGDTPFEELIKSFAPDLMAAARQLREIVLDVDPRAVEVVRFGSQTATYGVGPHEASEGYVYIRMFKRWVSLGFYRGVNLSDPEGLLEGTEPAVRHLKVGTFDSATEPATRALIVEAVAERRSALGI